MTPNPTPQPAHDHGSAGFCTDHGQLASDEPCRCMRSHAYIAPLHPGHCCFFPAGSTCHPVEVAAWEAERDQRIEPAPDGRTETVARVLREHYDFRYRGSWFECRCGAIVAGTYADHAAHQAAAVVAALDDETARLREEVERLTIDREADEQACARLRELLVEQRTRTETAAAERDAARAALDRVRAGINDAIPYLGERELAEPILRAVLDPEEPR